MHFGKGFIVPADVNLSVEINSLAEKHHLRKEFFDLVANIKLYKYTYRE